jgi:hypothetical protein
MNWKLPLTGLALLFIVAWSVAAVGVLRSFPNQNAVNLEY